MIFCDSHGTYKKRKRKIARGISPPLKSYHLDASLNSTILVVASDVKTASASLLTTFDRARVPVYENHRYTIDRVSLPAHAITLPPTLPHNAAICPIRFCAEECHRLITRVCSIRPERHSTAAPEFPFLSRKTVRGERAALSSIRKGCSPFHDAGSASLLSTPAPRRKSTSALSKALMRPSSLIFQVGRSFLAPARRHSSAHASLLSFVTLFSDLPLPSSSSSSTTLGERWPRLLRLSD